MTAALTNFTPFPVLIAAHAQTRPQGIAFQVDERSLDWKTLHEHTRQVARALVQGGLCPGDRVALLGAASLAYVECLFGTVAARACVVPLPMSASVDTLEALLADCGARVLFLDPDAGEAAAGWRRLAGRQNGAGGDLRAKMGWTATPMPPFAHKGPATRRCPWRGRGCLQHHLQLRHHRPAQGHRAPARHAPAAGARKGFFRPRRAPCCPRRCTRTPPSCRCWARWRNGGSCILMRKFDAGRFLALAAAQRATHTMLVPVQYKRILAHPDFDAQRPVGLVLSQSTGAPMELDLKRDILRHWPGRFWRSTA
jgi:long-chain acyl-CoA synthetase